MSGIKKPNNRRWLVVGAALILFLFYIGLSTVLGGPGFPLDDGWIHQTYARNLARTGHWEYVPGVVSAGSTAPLWTLLLTIGYLLRLPFLMWAFLVGGLCLVWMMWSGMALWRVLWPDLADRDWLAGLTLALTWPLIWAAASGMETLLFIALGQTILLLYARIITNPQSLISNLRSLLFLGILSGLLILTRPDGLVLLVLVGLGFGFNPAAILVSGENNGGLVGNSRHSPHPLLRF